MPRMLLLSAALVATACSGTDDGAGDPLTQLRASVDGPLAVRVEDGMVRTIRGTLPVIASGTATAKAEAFVTTWAVLFGLPEGSPTGALRPREVAAPGRVVVVFDRLHEGVPVLGAEIRVHVAGDTISFVSAALPADLDVDTTPTLADADAIPIAASALGQPGDQLEVFVAPELVVFNRGLFAAEAGPSVLAYHLGAQVRGASVAWGFIVDAHDGAVHARYDRAPSARNRTTYTAHNRAGFDAPIRAGATLWLDEARGLVDASADSDGIDAHDYALLIHDYYDAIHSWDSYDDSSGALDIYVHHNPAPGDNAAWFGDAMWFEDGMVTHDIFAHEVTHGVVEHSAGLVYLLESGAVNESMADVLAAYATRTTSWTIGAGSAVGVFRSLMDPSAHGQPETYADRMQLGPLGPCAGPTDCPGDPCVDDVGACIDGCAPPSACLRGECLEVTDPCANDSGGVHVNSGIPNRAAWLATATDQTFTVGTESVTGIGFDKAEQIYFLALTAYMGPGTSLRDTRDMVVDSCASHAFLFPVLGLPDFGITPRDCGVVINAFHEVGLGPRDSDLDAWDDDVDNCRDVANPHQEDSNDDGIGDACTAAPPRDAEVPMIEPSAVECPSTFATRTCEDLGTRACPSSTCRNPMPATWGRLTGFLDETPEYDASSRHYSMLCRYTDAAEFCQASFRPYWVPPGAADAGGRGPAWRACDAPGAIVMDCQLNSATHRAATSIPCLVEGTDPAWRAEVMATATEVLARAEVEAAVCP